jgi:L-threonylcarbamoyladenylate synthase
MTTSLSKRDRRITHRSHEQSIRKAVEILKRGGLVAFPTETVYGLGARAFDPEAVRRVFAAKGRPADNPLILHIAIPHQLKPLVLEVPTVARRLMDRFWPGPLTLVLRRSERVSPLVSAGLSTVAVRIPDHPVALALIRELGEPIAAPSANRSGRPSPTRAEHVVAELGDAVDLVLEGGPCRVGLESTVVDLTGDLPCILRPGAVTVEALQSVIGRVALLGPISKEEVASSPGLKHRHYAPHFKVVPIPSEDWVSAVDRWSDSGKRLGILCRTGVAKQGGLVYYRRVSGGESEYGRDLFAVFHEAEAAGVEVLLVETVYKKGIGVAIMDRLERATRNRAGE